MAIINKINKIIKSVFFEDKINNIRVFDNQIQQKNLFLYYQFLKNSKLKVPKFSDTGFSVYSQTDEDGLLLFIFALIGFSNKIVVDIASGSPYGSNTTNLICNWGCTGILVENDEALINKSKKFFTTHSNTHIFPPRIVQEWITTKNINKIFKANNIGGNIDLLSLDMDGVDYWILKNITLISPRVIVLEYQDILGPNKSLTVPYKSKFNRFDYHPDYYGASLLAYVRLLKQRNYRLIGVNKYCYNAFFIKEGLAKRLLPEISVKNCFYHPKVNWGIKNRFPKIKKFNWINV